MQLLVGLSALALTLTLASAAIAAGSVGGRGPVVVRPDGRGIPMRPPVFVQVDELAAFGDKQVRTAGPLEIRIVGDVEITPTEDGGLQIRFLDE